MKRTIMIAALVLSGCGDGQPMELTVVDQCMRVELFKSCMASLPAGPQSTHYNDWDDVVDSCESAAYYQSQRKKSQVKESCRP